MQQYKPNTKTLNQAFKPLKTATGVTESQHVQLQQQLQQTRNQLEQQNQKIIRLREEIAELRSWVTLKR
jgi:chromosome segregation ATPase